MITEKPVQVCLIDENEKDLETLSGMLLELMPRVSLEKAVGISDGIALLKSCEQVDFIVLSIEYGQNTCFEILREVRVTCPVIFCGAPGHNLSLALRSQGLRFLPKPFARSSVKEVISPLIVQAERSAGATVLSVTPSGLRKRFLVRHGKKWKSVHISEVAWFRAESKLCFIRTWSNHRYIIDYTLEELAQMLDPEEFFRVNRGFLVHIKSVKSVSPYLGGKLSVELSLPFDGEPIKVSKERAQEFKVWMGK